MVYKLKSRKFRALKRKHKITNATIATEMGVNVGNVSNWATNRYRINSEGVAVSMCMAINKLANKAIVTIDTLFYKQKKYPDGRKPRRTTKVLLTLDKGVAHVVKSVGNGVLSENDRAKVNNHLKSCREILILALADCDCMDVATIAAAGKISEAKKLVEKIK